MSFGFGFYTFRLWSAIFSGEYQYLPSAPLSFCNSMFSPFSPLPLVAFLALFWANLNNKIFKKLVWNPKSTLYTFKNCQGSQSLSQKPQLITYLMYRQVAYEATGVWVLQGVGDLNATSEGLPLVLGALPPTLSLQGIFRRVLDLRQYLICIG